MTLQELASIAEIPGALGVIASLVFVGWQIRENTIATKAHIHEQVTQTYLAFLNSAIANPEAYAAGIQTTDAAFSNFSAGEKTFFFGTATNDVICGCIGPVIRTSLGNCPRENCSTDYGRSETVVNSAISQNQTSLIRKPNVES